jgi:hypothetical protein
MESQRHVWDSKTATELQFPYCEKTATETTISAQSLAEVVHDLLAKNKKLVENVRIT